MLDLEPKSFTEKIRPVNASTLPHHKNNEFSMTSIDTMASLVQAQLFGASTATFHFLKAALSTGEAEVLCAALSAAIALLQNRSVVVQLLVFHGFSSASLLPIFYQRLS